MCQAAARIEDSFAKSLVFLQVGADPLGRSNRYFWGPSIAFRNVHVRGWLIFAPWMLEAIPCVPGPPKGCFLEVFGYIKASEKQPFSDAGERALFFVQLFWQDLFASEAKPKLVRPSTKRS